MFNVILGLSKRILWGHYVLVVHLTTPRARMVDANARCERMHQRLFGTKK